MTGFTETFVMATGFLLVCLLAGLLVPKRPARAPQTAEHEQTIIEVAEPEAARV